MIKNLSLTLLIVGSVACTTVVDIHEPINCLGIPRHNVVFSEKEKSSIPRPVVDKIDFIITTYKQRILTQCKRLEDHNELHKPKI